MQSKQKVEKTTLKLKIAKLVFKLNYVWQVQFMPGEVSMVGFCC